MSNQVIEFDERKFAIFGFCDSCGHSAAICRRNLAPQLTIDKLVKRLRCGCCGSTATSIRIIYTGAGEYAYGSNIVFSRPHGL